MVFAIWKLFRVTAGAEHHAGGQTFTGLNPSRQKPALGKFFWVFASVLYWIFLICAKEYVENPS